MKYSNTLWNRIFHRKELQQEIDKCKAIIGFGQETLQFVNEAKTLEDLVEVHKLAWSRGYQNENLGPCPWGMFRTESIPTMQPSEVYLGNIYGLRTANIPFWNSVKEETMCGNSFGINDDRKIYDLIFRQYHRHLHANINNIIQKARKNLEK